MWLLNYQGIDGGFAETDHFIQPYHKPMHSSDNRNISLTAHVLIALVKTAPMLQVSHVNLIFVPVAVMTLIIAQGEVKKYGSTGRQRAMKYLERYLAKLTDPYDLAITAYALAISKSSESDAAYGKLLKNMRSKGGRAYWAKSDIDVNKVRYEFNRPFLRPKDKQEEDALAVEATSYALLTLFLVEGGGVTILQDQVNRKHPCFTGQI